MSKPVKLYPIKDRWTHDAPATAHLVESRKAADALIATGAFTDDPHAPGRDLSAPDDELEPEPTTEQEHDSDEPAPDSEPAVDSDPDNT